METTDPGLLRALCLKHQEGLMSSTSPLSTFPWPLNHLDNKFGGYCHCLMFKSKRSLVCLLWLCWTFYSVKVANENDCCSADWPHRVKSQYKAQPGFSSAAGPSRSEQKCMNFCKPQLSKAAFLFQLTGLNCEYMCEWMSAFVFLLMSAWKTTRVRI